MCKAKAYAAGLRHKRATRVNHRYEWALKHITWSGSQEGVCWHQWLQSDDIKAEGSIWDNKCAQERRKQRHDKHIQFEHEQQITNHIDAANITREECKRWEVKAHRAQQEKCDAEEKLSEAIAALQNLETSVMKESLSRIQNFNCVICQDLMIETVVLQCGHTFCNSCLTTWWLSKKTCPSCRARCGSSSIRLHSMDGIILNEKGHFSSELLENFDRRKAEQALSRTPPRL